MRDSSKNQKEKKKKRKRQSEDTSAVPVNLNQEMGDPSEKSKEKKKNRKRQSEGRSADPVTLNQEMGDPSEKPKEKKKKRKRQSEGTSADPVTLNQEMGDPSEKPKEKKKKRKRQWEGTSVDPVTLNQEMRERSENKKEKKKKGKRQLEDTSAIPVNLNQQRKIERREKRRRRDEELNGLVPSPSTVKGWFRGKSFLLCGDKDWCSYICKLPASWLEKSIIDDLLKIAKGKKPHKNLLLSTSLDHKLRHPVDQPQFALPETHHLVHDVTYADLSAGLAAWTSLGSTIYFFGGHTKEKIHSRDIHYINTTVFSPNEDKFLKKCGTMVTERKRPKLVTLDGKIYVFGGETDYGNKEVVWVEVFEPQPNSFLGQCRGLQPPQSYAYCIDAVAVEKEKKIIVSCDHRVYEYDVERNIWVKIVYPLSWPIKLRSPCCQIVAVGSVLYWLDTNLVAYDMESKQFYMGPIEDPLLQHILENPDTPVAPKDFQVSLVHLGGDFFFVVWIAPEIHEILHFTMIRVELLNSLSRPTYSLRASVLSCQTVVSPIPLELKAQPLMI